MNGLARYLVPASLMVVLVAGPGCSRKFFRERADADVAGVITQKNHFPDWAVKNWFTYPHPDSRFADPFNPDRPPYPVDDYAARLLSPNPQHPTKKTGTGRFDGDGYLRLLSEWDAENRAEDTSANPGARGAEPEAGGRAVYAQPPYLSGLPASGVPGGPVAPPHPSNGSPPAAVTQWEPVAPSRPTPGAAPTAIGRDAPSAVQLRDGRPPAAKAPQEGSSWIAVKPQVTLTTEKAPAGPTVAEVHGPSVARASAPIEADSKLAPAVAVTPVLQPPTVLPDLPTVPDANPPAPRPNVPPAADAKPPEPRDAATPKAPGQFPSVQALLSTGGNDDDYLRALSTNQQGFRIKVDQAVELGLVNSREFQDRREDLYLAALPVTLERYNFAAQAFFTEQVVRNFSGSGRTDAGRMWSLDTATGFRRNFATGGSLLVRLANQVVIDLGSSRPDVAVSNFGLSFLQPFLRGGGLAVNLEALTQAERNMLYAMRSYARFRKLFYVATAAGPGGGLGLTNNPYGLQGLSVNLGRGIGGNLTAPVVGFLPLLQQSAIVSNQRQNVAALERLLSLYRAFREGGQQSDLQVGQVEVDLLNSRRALINGGSGGTPGIRQFIDSLDNFKLQLGLPVTVALDLENSPLKPVRDQLSRFEDLYRDLRELEVASQRYNPNDPPAQFRAHWQRMLSESELVKGTAFAKGIIARWDVWAKATPDQFKARADSLAQQRRKLLADKEMRSAKNMPDPPAEAQKLAELNAELDLAVFERALRVFESKPWLRPPAVGSPPTQEASAREVFEAFYLVVLEARNERVVNTRAEWPKLAPLPVNGADLLDVELDEAYTSGIQAALSARLDLMNARGQVVDAYRNIAVQANSLQGVFDVGYDLNATTPAGDNRPFAFSSDRARHTLTIRAELPIVRRAERNNYRAALISYQRQRRTLMAFEDNIANDVRGDIRELRTLAQLYRIQQRVVELAYSQVDNANALLIAPPVPGAGNDAGSAAALTQQALQNQSRLLTAQNDLYDLWVRYTTARMNLYLDLELLQLDDRGVWCDEQATRRDAAQPGADARTPERLPAPRGVVPGDGR